MPPAPLQALRTLDAMDKIVDLYPFTDLARDSGEPYNIKVDLRAKMADIRRNAQGGIYKSDYEFQAELMNTMNLLYDANTKYRAPEGYDCYFVRPFHLAASVDRNHRIKYYLRPGPLDIKDALWAPYVGGPPSKFYGMQVLKINGLDVSDFITKIARSFIGDFKDLPARFNAALRGRWAQISLREFPITDKNLDFVSTYELVDQTGASTTMRIGNGAYCRTPPTSIQSMIRRNTTPQSLNGQLEVSAGLDGRWNRPRTLADDMAVIPASLRRSKSETLMHATTSAPKTDQTVYVREYPKPQSAEGSKSANGVSESNVHSVRRLIANLDEAKLTVRDSVNNDTFFMKYSNGAEQLWIFQLLTFAPAEPDATMGVLDQVIWDAAGAPQNRRLIIDLPNTDGGLTLSCLPGWIVTRLNTAFRDLFSPLGVFDYKESKITDVFREHADLDSYYTSYKQFLDLRRNPATSAFYGPVQHTRAGTTSNYTKQGYRIPCWPVDKPTTQSPFQQIFIVTDGLCRGPCAQFASWVRGNSPFRFVTYGGIPSEFGPSPVPMSAMGSPGGAVLSYATVAFNSESYSSPVLPRKMLSTASATFTFHEWYETHELGMPQDYVRLAPDFHLDYYSTLYNYNPWTAEGLANNAGLYSLISKLPIFPQ